MRIIFEIEECNNKELLEKMEAVREYEEFEELAGEYGWSECVDAFAAVNDWFDYDYCSEWLYNFFYGEGCDGILMYAVINALDNKYPDESEE